MSHAPFLATYARYPLEIVKGEGHRIQDVSGRWYTDGMMGIAVLALGHRHPAPTRAMHEQLDRVVHTSNLVHTDVQRAYAKLLVDTYGALGLFFCNSGAEANEGLVKLVRKTAWRKGDTQRTEILVGEHAFHGRTLTAIAMTPKKKYQEGYAPLDPQPRAVPEAELAAHVSEKTLAVWIEPVQGEGGCREVPGLHALRKACDKHGAFLVYDEIQCGFGRTGAFVRDPKPDAIALAKPIGGGLPLGAFLVLNPALADTFQPGDHGTTFGGNPVACAGGRAVLEHILEHGLHERALAQGEKLAALLARTGVEITGQGLLRGAHLGRDAGPVVDAMRELGVVVCSAGPSAVRFLPALNVGDEVLEELADVFAQALARTA